MFGHTYKFLVLFCPQLHELTWKLEKKEFYKCCPWVLGTQVAMKCRSSLKQKKLEKKALWCTFFCVWDKYLPYTVFYLISGSVGESNNWDVETNLFQLKFVSVWLRRYNLQQLFFPNLVQFWVWWRPELYHSIISIKKSNYMPGREWKAAAFYGQSQGQNTLQ